MSFGLDRLSIRWRLALTSAGLTLLILSVFALVVAQLTASRVRSDFQNELAAAVDKLSDRVYLKCDAGICSRGGPNLQDSAAAGDATIRILASPPSGVLLDQTKGAADLGQIWPQRSARIGGLRVEARRRLVTARDPFNRPIPRLTIPVILQYGRKVSDVEATVSRVRFFLGLGVVGGSLLALLAGLMLGRRAMKPVTALTATARDIARTRDPSKQMPTTRAEDEVAELARTLQEMLDALEAASEETDLMLRRQRQFVADASHELRTPLTSILVNLELLAEVLDGERGDAAQSALRSSRRMRRLVADLLLLARADARRQLPREPTDVGQVLVDAAAELGPMANAHELTVAVAPALVQGTRDELHRLALNLMENALRHTPLGTHVHGAVAVVDDEVVLTVEDDGPGVPRELRDRVFERFVRGHGDSGSSSGLGLSIVRAVAESHGGSVELQDAQPGARFVVRLPRSPEQVSPPAPTPGVPEPV